MSRIIPADWMPPANAKRFVIHWTAGGPSANSLDKEHYHFIVEQDLDVIRGVHSVTDNDSTADGDYAAHCANLNTRCIGVSLCGMMGAVQNPFNPGPHPINEGQWDKAARIVAELADRYGIPITRETVTQHGEVPEALGILQPGKWDVCRLPWKPQWTETQVCNDFRARVTRHLQELTAEEEGPIKITAKVHGVDTTGFLHNAQALVAIRPLADAGLFTIQDVSSQTVELLLPSGPAALTLVNLGGIGHVSGRKLAEALNANLNWSSAAKRLTIG